MRTAISEKEFAIIKEISNNHRPNQRIIAKRTGISLGLTNLIIKRLIKKGYLKITEAPSKTIRYILTPKGFAEKTRKTYNFTLQTIKALESIRANIQEIMEDVYRSGGRDFIIFGNGELAFLAEIAFRNLNLEGAKLKMEFPSGRRKSSCNLLFNINGTEQRMDLLQEIAKKNIGH